MLNSKLCTSAAVALLGARSAPAAVAGGPGPHDDASGRTPVHRRRARPVRRGLRTRTTRLTPTGLVLVALLAGCGGDGEAMTRAEGAPASAAGVARPDSPFLGRAEAICKEANEKEAALGAPGIDWIHGEHFNDPDFLVDFHAVGRSTLRDLRGLTPPDEDRERYREALRAIAQMLGALEKQVGALRTGRAGATDAIADYEKGYLDLAAVGGVLGFTECLGVVL